MRYAVLSISTFVLVLCVGNTVAQERGIGVTPAKIEIGENAEWPYTAPLTVTNLSFESENFEVTLEKDEATSISISPGKFSLGAGDSTRVLVTFEEPRGVTAGVVKVVSTKTSVEGFTTGTGVKIPFQIERPEATKSLASVGEAFGGFGGFDQLFGAGMILVTLILLWYLSDIMRPWIFNISKR